MKDISKFVFVCDSPYMEKEKKRFDGKEVTSKGKCGFTSWQTGEITAKILNFAKGL